MDIKGKIKNIIIGALVFAVAGSIVYTLKLAFISGKGNLYGDVVYKTERHFIGRKEFPSRIVKFSNTDVFILKYTEHLPKQYKQLEDEFSKKINDKVNKYEDSTFSSSFSEKFFEEYLVKDLKDIRNEFRNRGYNLIFPYILKKVTTDDNGHYKFLNVQYGKYFVYSYEEKGLYWFIPIEINNKELKVDLTESNSYWLR